MRLIPNETYYTKDWYNSYRCMLDRCYRKSANNYPICDNRHLCTESPACDTVKKIYAMPTIEAVPVLNSPYEVSPEVRAEWGESITFEKAEPVVRCKDCKWYTQFKNIEGGDFPEGECEGMGFFKPDDFCSRGERKDGGENEL